MQCVCMFFYTRLIFHIMMLVTRMRSLEHFILFVRLSFFPCFIFLTTDLFLCDGFLFPFFTVFSRFLQISSAYISPLTIYTYFSTSHVQDVTVWPAPQQAVSCNRRIITWKTKQHVGNMCVLKWKWNDERKHFPVRSFTFLRLHNQTFIPAVSPDPSAASSCWVRID